MVCRHRSGDPNCSSSPQGRERAAYAYAQSQAEEQKRKTAELLTRVPDPDSYEVIRAEEIGQNLVMEVRYSGYTKGPFSGKKVLVFFKVSLKAAILWKRIDPEISDVVASKSPREAPSPRAVFPADDVGWSDALTYARAKH